MSFLLSRWLFDLADRWCGFDHQRVKALMTAFNHVKKLLAHPWFPEIADMPGHPLDPFGVGF